MYVYTLYSGCMVDGLGATTTHRVLEHHKSKAQVKSNRLQIHYKEQCKIGIMEALKHKYPAQT